MKLNPRFRLIAAIVSCSVLSIGMVIVKRGYSFTVIPPNVQLSDAPMQVGNWTAEKAELTEAEFGVLNAADVTSLRFDGPLNQVAFVHVATWTDPDEVAETCPHHPGVCYGGNGWFAMQTKRVEIEIDGIGDVPVEISLMDRGGERLVIAFTYAMGKHRFATDTDARLAQTRLWGQREWSAVTKYLLQLNSPDIDTAIPAIEELLGEFISWHDKADVAMPTVAIRSVNQHRQTGDAVEQNTTRSGYDCTNPVARASRLTLHSSSHLSFPDCLPRTTRIRDDASFVRCKTRRSNVDKAEVPCHA